MDLLFLLPSLSWLFSAVSDPMLPHCTPQVACHLRSNKYVTRAMGSGDSIFTEKDLPEGHRLGIEINLWRADLTTGVLELDGAGNIIGANDFKLYQPGLLLGVPNQAMLNNHISKYLPAAEGKPISEFFVEGFGAGSASADKGDSKQPRGLLKTTAGSRKQQAGPINIIGVLHHTDGKEVQLAVQAVPKSSVSAGLHLVMRPVAPKCGRPDFTSYLIDPEAAEAGAKEAAALAAAAADAVSNNTGSKSDRKLKKSKSKDSGGMKLKVCDVQFILEQLQVLHTGTCFAHKRRHCHLCSSLSLAATCIPVNCWLLCSHYSYLHHKHSTPLQHAYQVLHQPK